jgi:hypothetical protein
MIGGFLIALSPDWIETMELQSSMLLGHWWKRATTNQSTLSRSSPATLLNNGFLDP